MARSLRRRREPVPARRKGREDRGAARSTRPDAPPSAAILDSAFRTAYRATPHGQQKVDRARRRAQLKIIRSAAVVIRHLRLASRPFGRPGVSEAQRALLDQRFGSGTLGRSLLRLRRAEERIRGLSREQQDALRRQATSEEFAGAVRIAYGRLASFLREVDPDLRHLAQMARFLEDRPRLDRTLPTIAIAGFPNVGKSSLVARLSSAHPKVADYPFTTLALAVGHTDLGFDRLEVVDTPGVLGRPQRVNPAEAETRAAVAHGVDAVVFLIDPTATCGYPVAEQEALLARWQHEFPSLPILEVETKADLPSGPTRRLRVSAKTGEGVAELRTRLEQILKDRRPALPPIEESVEVPDEDSAPSSHG
ncbi:MAG TPA: GTPase [Thermoplasmata archaeon]|nr:GTPase [Thermoplasmata archaeon]